jgi:hypothetical protein
MIPVLVVLWVVCFLAGVVWMHWLLSGLPVRDFYDYNTYPWGEHSAYWRYEDTEAYQLGLTRVTVILLAVLGLLAPYRLLANLAELFWRGPSVVLRTWREDREALLEKKKDAVRLKKERIEKEYEKVVLEFEKWEKEKEWHSVTAKTSE